MIWTWLFWKDAIERAIRDACGATAGVLVLNNAPNIPGHVTDWRGILTVAGTSAVVSLLTSVSASRATNSPNAAIVEVKGDIPPGNSLKP